MKSLQVRLPKVERFGMNWRRDRSIHAGRVYASMSWSEETTHGSEEERKEGRTEEGRPQEGRPQEGCPQEEVMGMKAQGPHGAMPSGFRQRSI
jgi:hypothetical protein